MKFISNVPMLCVCVVIVHAQSAFAQNVSVQQPVISNFGLNTTVVVPDRGTAYLGSVGRSAFTRSDYGPLNFSRPIGKTTSHSGTSTSVWIHDFEAMDRALLGETNDSSRYSSSSVYGGAFTSQKPVYSVLGMQRRSNSVVTNQKYRETPVPRNSSDATLSLDELESALKSTR